jgi:hypothetical protein
MLPFAAMLAIVAVGQTIVIQQNIALGAELGEGRHLVNWRRVRRVFSKGRIAGEVPRAEFDEHRILSVAYQEYGRVRGN